MKTDRISAIFFIPRLILLLIILGTLTLLAINDRFSDEEVLLEITDQEHQNRDMFSQFRVTGYLPMYRMDTFIPDQLRYLSDVIFFAVASDSYGNIIRQIPNEYRKQLNKWQSTYPVRFHLGVIDHFGNDQSRGLSQVVRFPDRRRTFAISLRETVQSLGFQGADIDWEWPRNAWEKSLYTLLLQEVDKEFSRVGLELSIAMSPFQSLEKEAFEYIDYAHLMLYDTLNYHSTFEETQTAVEYLLKKGIPVEKLSTGVPFYGRGLANYGKNWRQVISYRRLMELNLVDNSDDIAGGYYFNNIQTIIDKTVFSVENGLGGMMIWELGQDVAGPRSLLQQMYSTINDQLFHNQYKGHTVAQGVEKSFKDGLGLSTVYVATYPLDEQKLASMDSNEFQSPVIRRRRFRFALNRYV